MQDKIFSSNLVLKYIRSTKIDVWSMESDCIKPDCPEPEHVEPNQDLHNSIIMCIQKRTEHD